MALKLSGTWEEWMKRCDEKWVMMSGDQSRNEKRIWIMRGPDEVLSSSNGVQGRV